MTCRWPFGDPRKPGFRFCCAPVAGGASYCAEHRLLAFTGPAVTARQMRDDLRFARLGTMRVRTCSGPELEAPARRREAHFQSPSPRFDHGMMEDSDAGVSRE
ncbi:GcrA family cell cycle regulator [Neoasaia chiangmaiensis]|uniref:GcrA family cell cycle regulator n=1 Tax=Neoasaia chiangmaiensis TaxID=320497 RepID=UPI00098B4E0F|nr:GcrA family cell cycle regulator [Neoasaia chiangmaiensis]